MTKKGIYRRRYSAGAYGKAKDYHQKFVEVVAEEDEELFE